jgi:hypothetical protein
LRSRSLLAGAMLALTCASILPTIAFSSDGEGAPSAEMTLDQATSANDKLRAQLRRERRAHKKALLRVRRAAVSQPDVQHALALGAAAYGLPKGRLENVAFCESRFNSHATNGQYSGLFQFGSRLWNATPYKTFERTDPYASSFAAAWAFSRGMARHWPVCG